MGQAPSSKSLTASPVSKPSPTVPPSSSKAPASVASRSIGTARPPLAPGPPSSVGKAPNVSRSSTITARPASVRGAPAPPIKQPALPLERERNLKRKKGFDYLLVTIEFQKGKKFGLGMVHTENRVLVNKVDDGSMCSDSMKYLDRICDVEGIPVTDKELCKKQIVKALKKDQKVSLAVERPITKDRISQVQDLLKRLETQPPSVVLEMDVRDIIARYNQRLQRGEIGKEQSAMKKKDHAAAKVSLDPGIPTIPIGMDNSHLQEDLEKVPVKTYETSLARLQNQDDAQKSAASITTMLNQQEQMPQSPVLQTSPIPPPEIPAMPAMSIETQNPAPQALVPVSFPEQKLNAVVAPSNPPAPEPPGNDYSPCFSHDNVIMELKEFEHINGSTGDLHDASTELDNIQEEEQPSVRLQYGLSPFTRRFKLLFKRLVRRFVG
ncbi:unnamed protein product [Cylicocyclus nassatus]|uniref:PDZ domain-containing protein n=1 Tax=Cylicocyclus nassatus TaxID=53992 RepID=A0AA36GWV2_CYLNA|nr:unnamed protein product [Cylicocyclus nassatus]